MRLREPAVRIALAVAVLGLFVASLRFLYFQFAFLEVLARLVGAPYG